MKFVAENIGVIRGNEDPPRRGRTAQLHEDRTEDAGAPPWPPNRGGKLAPPVIGGLGGPFLGRHVVAKLREHGATQFEVVDRDRYDPSAPLRAGSFDCAQDRLHELARRKS